jgi:hypothetical protein
MNFTPKNRAGSIIDGLLAIVVAGSIAWFTHLPSEPIAYSHSPVVASMPAGVPPVELAAAGPSGPSYYQPVSSWYKNKHWWKRNAPIVGGAGGGALVGGLVGGGTGAVIGGAAGGGAGYLYKRHKTHERHREYYNHTYK